MSETAASVAEREAKTETTQPGEGSSLPGSRRQALPGEGKPLPEPLRPQALPAAAGAAGGTPRPWLSGPRGFAFFLAFALVLAAVDLWSKEVVFSRIGEHETVVVIPGFFNLVLAKNFGAAFSVGWGMRNLFVIVSCVAFCVLSYFSWSNRTGGKLYQVTLAMIASGVIGNVHDRVRLGYVRDFIDWYAGNGALAEWLFSKFGTQHWPTFNVADSCICVGTAFLLVKFWKDERAAERAARAEAAAKEPTGGAAGGAGGAGA